MAENDPPQNLTKKPNDPQPSPGNIVPHGQANVRIQSSVTYFMPMPPAQELAKYEEIVPGTSERLLRVYEADSEAANSNDRWLVRSGVIRAQLGQFFALVITLLAFYWGVQLIREGHGMYAAILIGSVLTSIVIAFLASRPKDKE